MTSVPSEGYACIKDLRRGDDASVEATLKTLGERLATLSYSCSFQLTLYGPGHAPAINLIKVGNGLEAVDSTIPAIECVTKSETWDEIAAARLSPLEAFLLGKLRIRGDVAVAQNLLAELSEGNGISHLCGDPAK